MESDLLAESELTGVAAETLEVAIPVPDGETYWETTSDLRWSIGASTWRSQRGAVRPEIAVR
jgi:hypothetical protein